MGNVSRIIIPSPHVQIVNYVGKLALGDGVSGASSGESGITLHVVNDSHDALAQTILDAMNTLLVLATKTEIQADGVDQTVITMVTVDTALDWILFSDGEIIGSGTEAAVAGVVTLEFESDVGGAYEIWLVRRTGDYATGRVVVEALNG